MKRPESAMLALALMLPLAQDGWKRVEPGLQLEFPADHGAHLDYRTEWWYVTGNVADAAGERYGFQLTFFRNALAPGQPENDASPLRAHQVYAGHLAVTDVATERTRHAERLRRASALVSVAEDDLAIEVEDWWMRRERDGALLLDAADSSLGIGLALRLVPSKPLVLHGEGGVSSKGAGPGNASAYTSWTRLKVEGELRATPEKQATAVHGSAWFDHEFGSSVLGEGVVGWDWFGLQLDDGRDFMLFQLRGIDSSVVTSSGTRVDPDGGTTRLNEQDISIEPLELWTSPGTKAEYPAAWRIALGGDESFDVRPLVQDAEINARRLGVVYWEGPLEVRSNGRTEEIVGRGYGELTGYAGSMRGRF